MKSYSSREMIGILQDYAKAFCGKRGSCRWGPRKGVLAVADKHVYPAVFDPDERGPEYGYTVTFPDLPGCITEGNSLEEALNMAQEALQLHLYGMEADGDEIPKPTPPEKIKAPVGAFVTLVQAMMPLVRERMSRKSVNKTLTLPKWLNDLAEEKHINFSHVLQSALKERLGVFEPHSRQSPSYRR
jgi:predicted RNase H-like HicB family nuclease